MDLGVVRHRQGAVHHIQGMQSGACGDLELLVDLGDTTKQTRPV